MGFVMPMALSISLRGHHVGLFITFSWKYVWIHNEKRYGWNR